MERSEPSFIPEWLKNSGSITGAGNTSSSLQSDDHSLSKPTRNKSTLNINDHDLGRPSVSNRTTSSYFRRSSSSNGSGSLQSRSYRSFGRSNHDKDMHISRDKSILDDHRHWDYPDPFDNILPRSFEKERLRRSYSMVSGNRGELGLKKVASDASNGSKNSHNNGIVQRATFEREFPSLGAEEREAVSEIGRIPSPGLTASFQSLQIGGSSTVGGDKWTSALAEVPAIIGSHVQESLPASSTGLNMAETLAHGPSRAQTIPQAALGTQRLEELAIKQSRQLIPVTPSMPKALTLNSSEKPKPKQQQQQAPSSHLVNHSPRGGPVKPDFSKSDFSKTSSVGNFQVLKPAREKNSASTTPKDGTSSPTSSGKIVNSPLSVAPSAVLSAPPLRNLGNSPILSERKPGLAMLEKRPATQAQKSRHDFFNLVRKKSMANSSSAPEPGLDAAFEPSLDAVPEPSPDPVPEPGPDAVPSVFDKPEKIAASAVSQAKDAPLVDDMTRESGDEAQSSPKDNRKRHLSSDTILSSEEEEAAFLRSLGWEENGGEDEGLTEEEISEFYRDLRKYMDSRPSSKILQGKQPRLLHPLKSAEGVSSSFDSKLES